MLYLLLLLPVLLLLLGPRLPGARLSRLPLVADDIEQWVSQAESQVSGVSAQTQKKLIRSSSGEQQTTFSIVYLHGYSASRQEISPVCEQLATRFGANLFMTRFTGHGGDAAAMGEIQAEDLLSDAVEALEIGKRIGRRVIVIGNSTGATLATWLAHQYPEDIAATVLMSPNYGLYARSEFLLWPWGAQLLRLLQGSEYAFEPANELQRRYWHTRFPSRALLPMMSLIKTVRALEMKKITTPTLMLYCRRDRVVSVSRMLAVFARLGSKGKRLVEIENATSEKQHVLAGDVLSPQSTETVINEIAEFIEQSVAHSD